MSIKHYGLYRAKTHVLVVGLMAGMMADFYGLKTVAGSSILATYVLLHFL